MDKTMLVSENVFVEDKSDLREPDILGGISVPIDHESYSLANASITVETLCDTYEKNIPQNVSVCSDNEPDISDLSDSSDKTYNGSESDVPSEVLRDVEGSSDEDIFFERTMDRGDVLRKFKKMNNDKGSSRAGDKRKINESNLGVDWFSDPGEEDEDLLSMEESDEDAPRHPVYKEGQDMKSFKLVVGMKFKSAKEFREVLRDYSVREGYELLLQKNENCRITATCNNSCNWRIHASLVMGGPTFQIKTIKGEHTCAKSHVNKLANYKYLAKRIESIVRDNPDIKIDQLKNLIMRKCAVDVSKWKIIRAKKAALQKIRGVNGIQYELLWDYCGTVLKFNPGSKFVLRRKEDYNPPTFDKMYFSLHAMKKSFLSGCRPIIGLDGCFLKTVHGGQLLVAVGRDGNDNMIPIALAVVQVENKENWTWFLRELLDDIGGLGENVWTFISDRQKGLIEALKELVPDSEHRYCLRHMYQNFKKKFRGLELKNLFWKAATTANKNEFNAYMKQIAQVDPKIDIKYETAAEWLQKIPLVHWARSHFSTTCLSDVVVNNLCESFNSYILDARDKPIITMFESIRTKLMKRIQVKRLGMENYVGDICPNIMKKINKCQKFSRNCFAIYSGELEYQIQCLTNDGVVRQYVVDLGKKTCSCGMFQLCGYPCCHACSAIGESRHRLEDYVHTCYSKAEYMRVYSHMVHAVPGQADYCKTSYQPLHAPVFRKKKGRPQKMRRKEADESHNTSTRKGLRHKCSRCLELGHKKASCTNPIHPKSKMYKVDDQPNRAPDQATQPTLTGTTSQASNISVQELDAAARRIQKLDGIVSASAWSSAIVYASGKAVYSKSSAVADTYASSQTTNASSSARADGGRSSS